MYCCSGTPKATTVDAIIGTFVAAIVIGLALALVITCRKRRRSSNRLRVTFVEPPMEPLEPEKEEYLDPIPAPLPIAHGPHYGMPSLTHHDSFNLRVAPPASLITANANILPPIGVSALQNPFA